MRIEFETEQLNDNEACGLMLLLAALRPNAETAMERIVAGFGGGDTVTITGGPGALRVDLPPGADAIAAADVFTPPADAAFTAPLEGSIADGAAASDGSTATATLADASAAAPTTSPTGVTVDKDGWPHDKRIHSENPTLTTKGVWRGRRFKTDAERTAAEAATHAELRAQGYGVPPVTPSNPSAASAAPAPAASPAPTASSPAAPSSAPAATVGGEAASPPAEAVSAAAAPAPPPVPATPALPAELTPSAAAPTAPTADTAVNPMVRFTGIMQAVTAAQGATPPRITQNDVTAILQTCGLASMRELATAPPATVDTFQALFDAHLMGA